MDFNFPEHLAGLEPQQVLQALSQAKLTAGAISIRFPATMVAGGFTNPDAVQRALAVQVVVDGCKWALDLGSTHVIVWPAYDGYDYHFQADYLKLWKRTVDAFTTVADACSGVNVSLEFKPTHETTRFAAIPSTGAALLLAQQVGRSNFGLTLDLGHLLMAGENAAQSIAMVGAAGKLFGVHLNDGHQRLGAEDGLAFASVHPTGALEAIRWLQRVGYTGAAYFDTFPLNEDPVREAEYNIRRFKALWKKAASLGPGLDAAAADQDGMKVLELLEGEGG